jgi:hypothetical protein
MWVDFLYLICIFCIGEIMSLISFEKTSKGKWLVAHFILLLLSRGCACFPSLKVEALNVDARG